MKRTYLVMAFVLAAMVVTGFSPAYALEAKLSGQVNQMGMWADDGDEDDFFVTDNDSSSTRIRFTGEETFGAVKAGVQVEMEAQRNASNLLTMEQDSDGGLEWNDRWLNVYFDTQMGKFEIGKGDGAANNTSEQDLSGTAVITYSDPSTTAGGFIWKNDEGDELIDLDDNLTDDVVDFLTIGDTRNNFDGLSRNERLRYNTPLFGGAYLAASATNGEAWEVAAFYAAEIYGKLAAAIGYVDNGDRSGGEFTQLGGSVSWLLPMGLNFTAALGERDYDDSDAEDPFNYYFKVGYKWDIHAVSVEYGMTEDMLIEDLESDHYGAAYVVNPWKPVEFYAAYRVYMAELNDLEPEDIQQAMVGTRIKF